MSNEGIIAILVLVVFIICIVAKVISNMNEDNNTIDTSPTYKPIRELSDDELKNLLSEVENDLETVKIEYQGALANPYVLYITRNLIKQRLDDTVERRQYILDEINKRQKEAATKAEHSINDRKLPIKARISGPLWCWQSQHRGCFSYLL